MIYQYAEPPPPPEGFINRQCHLPYIHLFPFQILQSDQNELGQSLTFVKKLASTHQYLANLPSSS
jgi:hypothetical protein